MKKLILVSLLLLSSAGCKSVEVYVSGQNVAVDVIVQGSEVDGEVDFP